MRRLALTLLALAAIASILRSHDARADDTYANITLKPGADAGTLATTLAFPVGGNQAMIRCDTFAVRLRLCDSTTTCTATSNDTPIEADKSIDLCPRPSQRSLSVFRTYDGGVPDCRLYVVNPKTVCPP